MTTGQRNTALGAAALFSLTTGSSNTAVGTFALSSGTGTGHTAVGAGALENNLTGDSNTAVGHDALRSASGSRNVAIGRLAVSNLQTGNDNVAIGSSSGAFLTSGNNNIYIASSGSPSAAAENGTIRIGGGNHGAAFIGGIRGGTVDGSTELPVLIDSTGKLGTVASSARFKQDIKRLDDASRAVLRLEPVSFRFTVDQGRGDAVQYGLIAEQVAEVMPELVLRDQDGQPYSVKYHVLPTLLLAEIQRLERERAAQEEEIEALRDAVRELREQRR